METATPIANAHNLKIVENPNLMDTNVGKWQGKSLALLRLKKEWKIVQSAPSRFQFPDGESFLDLQSRIANVLEGIVPDTLFTGLLSGVKAIRQARRAKAALGTSSYIKAADMMADDMRSTGQAPSSGSDDVFKALGDSTPGAPGLRPLPVQGGFSVAARRQASTLSGRKAWLGAPAGGWRGDTLR